MKSYYPVLMFLFLVGCANETNNNSLSDSNVRLIENDDWELSFTEHTIKKKAGTCTDTTDSFSQFGCLDVKITYPEPTAGYDSLTDAVDKTIVDYFSDFLVTESIAPYNSASEYLTSALNQLEKEFTNNPQETLYLDATIEPIYSNKAITCLESSYSVYTGGAHPNSAASYYIFDNNTGLMLEANDIIDQDAIFKQLQLNKMKAAYNLKAEQDISEAGFLITDTEFIINNNIGVTSDSLYVTYVPYEIAPYVMGYTHLAFAKSEMKELLFPDFLNKWE